MSGQLALQPNVSLSLIQATATSVRLHAAAPGSYANAVSTSLGIRSFVAGTFFTLTGGQVLTVAQFSGQTLAGGTVAWFSICDDVGSKLLAVGPLPSATTLDPLQTNWLLSIAGTANLGAPAFSSP